MIFVAIKQLYESEKMTEEEKEKYKQRLFLETIEPYSRENIRKLEPVFIKLAILDTKVTILEKRIEALEKKKKW